MPSPTPAVVEVEALTKHYGDVRALDGVSLRAEAGEIFGLLGHNGAGKSTMIRILTGRAKPTSGRARVLGHEVPRDLEAVRGEINLVAETPNVYQRATAKENLELFCALYGLPKSRATEVLEQMRLSDVAKRRVKTFSTGIYNATIEDDGTLPTTEVAIVEPAVGAVAEELRRAAGKSAKLEILEVDDAARARTFVADGTVDLAVVAERPASARALVLVAQDAGPTAQGVVGLVPDALARASGRTPAAQTRVRAVAPADQQPYEIIDERPLAILIAIVLLVTFVAMMVVPIQTAEELETGTFGALRLAATGPEILAGKALAGFIYALVGVALTVVITNLEIDAPVAFFAATLALVVSLVGFGLLLGLLMPNANTINTYGAFLSVRRRRLRGVLRRLRRDRDDPRPAALQPGGEAARRRALVADAV